MSNDNKEIARRYVEQVWNRGNLEVVDELVAPDYRGVTRAAGQTVAEGPAGLKAWVSGLSAAFDGIEKSVRAILADGDEVVAEVAFTATHRASGTPVHADQVYMMTLREGRIVRESVFFDVGGIREAIGSGPACAVR